MGRIDVSITDITDIQALSSKWKQLEYHAKPSYFLSWAWTGTWLSLLPESVCPKLLTARLDGIIIGLAIIIRNRQSRRGLVFPSRTLVMNETGDPFHDLLTIEYNDLLVKPDHQPEVTIACLDFLQENVDNWDELIIRAADDGSPLTNPQTIGQCRLQLKVNSDLSCWYIDLEKLRKKQEAYLDSLSSNTRYQLRRAIRECEKLGQLELSIAQSIDEAQAYLLRLAELHQKYWNGKGRSGCFSNPFFSHFHETLINNRFGNGEIQLMRISAGEAELGYLYNFVMDGYVHFYQSGLDYELGNKLKPGLIAHYKAVEHNLEQGMTVYDFLAGNDRYKRSLSTDKHRLVWVSLQKDRLKFRLEDLLNQSLKYCKKFVRGSNE